MTTDWSIQEYQRKTSCWPVRGQDIAPCSLICETDRQRRAVRGLGKLLFFLPHLNLRNLNTGFLHLSKKLTNICCFPLFLLLTMPIAQLQRWERWLYWSIFTLMVDELRYNVMSMSNSDASDENKIVFSHHQSGGGDVLVSGLVLHHHWYRVQSSQVIPWLIFPASNLKIIKI